MEENMNINIGSIVTVYEKEYIDFPGGSWAEHFYTRKKHYVVRTFPSNNGNFIGEDYKHQIRHINCMEVISVK